MTADHSGPDVSSDLDARVGHPAPDRSEVRLGDDSEFQTQLADVRTRLLRDAAPAGIDGTSVQRAVDETISGYESASVRSFLAVLIERDVRSRLTLARYVE